MSTWSKKKREEEHGKKMGGRIGFFFALILIIFLLLALLLVMEGPPKAWPTFTGEQASLIAPALGGGFLFFPNFALLEIN